MTTEEGLDIVYLTALRFEDMARANNALRRWIFLQGLIMPSEERLTAWWTDLERLKDMADHRLQWVHNGKHLRIWRQKLSVSDPSITLGRWDFIKIDADSDELGLAMDVYQLAVAKEAIQEKVRSGGEKIRIHPRQSRKTLKKIFQELNVPPWQRTARILCLDDEVLAVAGVGLHVDLLTQYGPRVKPVFIKEIAH
jgi:tRNA(Ile)-lysidine synthase